MVILIIRKDGVAILENERGRVGWVEPKAKPTVSMPINHSRKIIGITRFG
jgi:hypothetical protein